MIPLFGLVLLLGAVWIALRLRRENAFIIAEAERLGLDRGLGRGDTYSIADFMKLIDRYEEATGDRGAKGRFWWRVALVCMLCLFAFGFLTAIASML